MRRFVVDTIFWVVWVPMREILVRLPRGVVSAGLRFLSSILFLVDSRRRSGIIRELGLLFGNRFGERELRKIARNSMNVLVRRMFENLHYKKLDLASFERIAGIEGIQHLEAALERGKGALTVTFHFGSFTLLPFALALRGFRANALTGVPFEVDSHVKNKFVQLRDEELASYPFATLKIRSSLMPIAKALKRNEIVALTVDGRQGKSFVPVKMLERTALFATGIFGLAAATGAAVLPVGVVREDGKHRIIVEPELVLERGFDEQETLRINAQKFVSNYEKYLLEFPDHYGATLYSMKHLADLGLDSPLFIDQESGFSQKK